MKDLGRKDCKTDDKASRHDQRCLPGKIRDFPHPLIVSGRIVVSDQRHKSLAQPHRNVQGKLIDPFHDPISRHRNISISRRKLYNDHVRRIAKVRGQSRRQAHGKYLTDKAKSKVFRMKRYAGPLSQPHIDHNKKHDGSQIGKCRRDRGPRHIKSESEDKQRIKNDIQDPSEHHPRACRAGMTFAPEEMTERKAQHSRHSSKNNNPEQIALGISIRIRAGSEEIQQRPAKQKRKKGKDKCCSCSAPYTERRYIFDILMVLFPEHPRDQTCFHRNITRLLI